MTKIEEVINKINKVIVDESGIDNVVKVLRSGILSRPEGSTNVKEFQRKMSVLLNQRFCFATTSGTSSLHATMALLNLKKGDEILVPAMTFMADASVVLQEGAKPVFVDISEKDFNLDPDDAIRKISKKTRAIIVVHLYGQPAKMSQFVKIAKKYKLVLIEDCAQATGATYNNRQVGSFGDISCFSFYQAKNLVAGEGGLIATSNENYVESLRSLLNNGIKRACLDDYDFDRVGFNYQMTEIQAALLLSQLNRLDKLNNLRRKNARIYKEILKGTDLRFQEESSDSTNVYCYLTGVLPERLNGQRDLFLAKVMEQGVPIKKQYPISLPETELIRRIYPNAFKDTPIANDFSKRVFNLYVTPGLTEKDIRSFANKILKVYRTLKQ